VREAKGILQFTYREKHRIEFFEKLTLTPFDRLNVRFGVEFNSG
jgi:hypothetical protein